MNRLVINADLGRQKISRHIYGHFAEHLGRCIYEGLWVGEDSPIPNTRGFRNDVVEALRAMHIPNLRWPGGCFADTYHWRDGIGPRESRPGIVNVHWGGTVENNHCGTHEFLDLCAQISNEEKPCEPYICGNVGSGTVQEMAEWLEYLTMAGQSPMADLRRQNGREEPWSIKYWAVGNENWGCGGNMRAEYYADEYRRYATFCRNFSGGKLYKVACGNDDAWNEVLIRQAHRHMDGISIHYYTVPGPWHKKGSATAFSLDEYYLTLSKAREAAAFTRRTAGLLDRYDPAKRIGIILDEWGTWFDVEPGTNPGHLYQQNTVRDALVAGLTLNDFNGLADRLHMANIAQTVNVLQAMALTDGPRMLLTPTYHVFEMYKGHQDALLLPTFLDSETVASEDAKDGIPQISASASRDESTGRVLLTLCNMHHENAAEVKCEVRGMAVSSVSGRVLTGDSISAHNTFDAPETVRPVPFTDFKLSGDQLTVSLPARSVAALELA
jgi:alpha-L-arabinofuranosidase